MTVSTNWPIARGFCIVGDDFGDCTDPHSPSTQVTWHSALLIGRPEYDDCLGEVASVSRNKSQGGSDILDANDNIITRAQIDRTISLVRVGVVPMILDRDCGAVHFMLGSNNVSPGANSYLITPGSATDTQSFYYQLYNNVLPLVDYRSGHTASYATLALYRDAIITKLRTYIDAILAVRESTPIVISSVPDIGITPNIQLNPAYSDSVKRARVRAFLVNTLNPALRSLAEEYQAGFFDFYAWATAIFGTDGLLNTSLEIRGQTINLRGTGNETQKTQAWLSNGRDFNWPTSCLLANGVMAAWNKSFYAGFDLLTEQEIVENVLGVGQRAISIHIGTNEDASYQYAFGDQSLNIQSPNATWWFGHDQRWVHDIRLPGMETGYRSTFGELAQYYVNQYATWNQSQRQSLVFNVASARQRRKLRYAAFYEAHASVFGESLSCGNFNEMCHHQAQPVGSASSKYSNVLDLGSPLPLIGTRSNYFSLANFFHESRIRNPINGGDLPPSSLGITAVPLIDRQVRFLKRVNGRVRVEFFPYTGSVTSYAPDTGIVGYKPGMMIATQFRTTRGINFDHRLSAAVQIGTGNGSAGPYLLSPGWAPLLPQALTVQARPGPGNTGTAMVLTDRGTGRLTNGTSDTSPISTINYASGSMSITFPQPVPTDNPIMLAGDPLNTTTPGPGTLFTIAEAGTELSEDDPLAGTIVPYIEYDEPFDPPRPDMNPGTSYKTGVVPGATAPVVHVYDHWNNFLLSSIYMRSMCQCGPNKSGSVVFTSPMWGGDGWFWRDLDAELDEGWSPWYAEGMLHCIATARDYRNAVSQWNGAGLNGHEYHPAIDRLWYEILKNATELLGNTSYRPISLNDQFVSLDPRAKRYLISGKCGEGRTVLRVSLQPIETARDIAVGSESTPGVIDNGSVSGTVVFQLVDGTTLSIPYATIVQTNYAGYWVVQTPNSGHIGTGSNYTAREVLGAMTPLQLVQYLKANGWINSRTVAQAGGDGQNSGYPDLAADTGDGAVIQAFLELELAKFFNIPGSEIWTWSEISPLALLTVMTNLQSKPDWRQGQPLSSTAFPSYSMLQNPHNANARLDDPLSVVRAIESRYATNPTDLRTADVLAQLVAKNTPPAVGSGTPVKIFSISDSTDVEVTNEIADYGDYMVPVGKYAHNQREHSVVPAPTSGVDLMIKPSNPDLWPAIEDVEEAKRCLYAIQGWVGIYVPFREITFSGGIPASGSYTLRIHEVGPNGGNASAANPVVGTTAAIPWNASAGDIKAAIEALGVGPVGVRITNPGTVAANSTAIRAFRIYFFNNDPANWRCERYEPLRWVAVTSSMFAANGTTPITSNYSTTSPPNNTPNNGNSYEFMYQDRRESYYGNVATPVSTTVFRANTTPLSLVDDYYVPYVLTFRDGPLAGQARQISDYVASTGEFTVTEAFSGQPEVGNQFHILGAVACEPITPANPTGATTWAPIVKGNAISTPFHDNLQAYVEGMAPEWSAALQEYAGLTGLSSGSEDTLEIDFSTFGEGFTGPIGYFPHRGGWPLAMFPFGFFPPAPSVTGQLCFQGADVKPVYKYDDADVKPQHRADEDLGCV